MNITIEKIDLNSISKEEELIINMVLNKSPFASIFHTVHWNKLLIEEMKLKNTSLLAMNDGKPVAFHTYYEDRESGITRLSSPEGKSYSFYGAPIAVPGYEEAIPELLKASEKTIKRGIWSIRTPPNYPIRPLTAAGYKCWESFTCLIDLQKEEEELFKGIKRSTRTTIRKAIRSGVSITEGTSADFDEFYSIYKSFYEQINEKIETKLFILPARFFLRVWEEFSRRNEAFMLIGRLEKLITNGAICLCYKDMVYAWIMGTKYEYRQHGVDSLLFWEIMKWGRDHGYKYWDNCDLSMPSPEKSKRMHFKRAFGGKDSIFYFAVKKTKGHHWNSLYFYLSHPKKLVKRIFRR